MMKQNYLKSLFLMLMMLVGMGAWAEEVIYKTALFGSDYNSKGVSSYTGSFSATNDGFTVDIANFNNNNNGWSYIKTGNKTNASVGTITTNTAIDKAITKVVITIDAITASSVNNIQLYSGSSASSCTYYEGIFSSSTGSKEVEITNPAANKFYKISFDCAKGSSNGLVTVSKVEYYVEDDGTTPDTPEPTKYDVTVANGLTGGTISANPTSAAEGATVTLTATPDAEYAFGSWNVTNATTSEAITVTDNKFTMPAANVNVSATFATIPEKTIAEFIASEGGKCYLTGTVSNIANTTYGNFDLTDESGTIYIYGCLNEAGEAKKFAELGVVAGDKIKVLAGTYEYFNNTTHEAKNVKFVEIVEKGTATQYTVSISEIQNGTVTANPTSAAEGDVVTLTPKAADGYEFVAWDVKGADNNAITVENNKFTMPAQNVTVSATFKEIAPEAEHFTFDLSEDNTVAASDELLVWTSTYASMYAQKAGSGTATNNYYPGTEGKAYTSTRFYNNSTLTFNPAPGITITSIVYNATTTTFATTLANSKWTNATAKASETNVTITPEDRTAPVTVTMGGNTGATSVLIYYTGEATDAPYYPTTETPGTDPEEKTYTISVKEDIFNGSVTVSPEEAKAGETVTITATPEEGYEVEEYIAYNSENSATEVTVTDGTFIMPAYNVTVNVLFKKKQGGETPDTPDTPVVGDGVTYSFAMFDKADDVTFEANGFTITLHKNTGSTAPQWNENSTEARLYAVGSVEVTSTKNIVKVVYDYNVNPNKNNVTPTIDGVEGKTNAGTWDATTKTWTGKDNTVTLTTSGSAGNLGFKSITVYFEEEAAPTNGTLNFKATNEDAYWATFSCDKDVIFDANDVIVYTVAVDDNQIVMIEANNNSLSCVTDKTKDEGWVAGYYVQAGAAVLINSVDESVNYYFIDTDPFTSNDLNEVETDPEYNMLVPCTSDGIFKAEADGNMYYKLAYGDYTNKTKLGFWWGADDGSANFKVKAGGAVLCVPQATATSVKGFSFDMAKDEDAIKGVEKKTFDTVIYDMQGRKVSKTQKGLYIINGRKMVK